MTLDGKPLAGAVITFVQIDEDGTTCSADVDEDGHHALSHRTLPGAVAAPHWVAISYKSDKGSRSTGPPDRSQLIQPAEELIPVESRDMGRTILKQTIPPEGWNSIST